MSIWRTLATGAVALALGAGLVTATPAAAVNPAFEGFDPGMIISDALFFDGDAMTAAQVQTFLNQKVPTCHPEKEEAVGGDPDDIVCLKDYSTTTVQKDADAYCKGYTGGRTQTAAQIIDGVARSCGVSQKVLLVTLQKEQGLVTHDWPSPYRYRAAMGYACPDGAPCDAAYYGFFNQVYMAARQFKRYAALPNNYGYRAGQWNVIKYNPDSSCGTKDVFIENQATAGLYVYTPYTPNAAALDAKPGVSVTCGSYGNRNFYYYFTSWFGSTDGPVVDNALLARWQQLGGIAGPGPAIAAAKRVAADGGGILQKFRNGTLYLRDGGTVTYRANGWAISEAYYASGGPAGPWGWPLTDSFTVDGVPIVEFTHVRVGLVDGEVVVGHPFGDVSDNTASHDFTEHAESIWWMKDSGLAQGWAGPLGREYRPLAPTTRDAMAAFLHRFVGEEFTAPETPTFVDVTPQTTQFYAEIEWLAASGIATGWDTPAGLAFRPTATITRDAMAAFLYRMAAPADYVAPAQSPFVDVTPESTEFYTEICWLADMGISSGWTTEAGQEFRPTRAITRDAMATFMHRFARAEGLTEVTLP